MYLKENEEELGHGSGAVARVRRERKPGRLKVEEVDEPQIEGPLEVIVRIGAPGLCRPCWAGIDMHCVVGVFLGLDADGGFAELLKTNARGVVKLPEGVEPKDVAAHADAGLTAYHAVKKAQAALYPGTRAVVIGASGDWGTSAFSS